VAADQHTPRLAQIAAIVLRQVGIAIPDSPPPAADDFRNKPTLEFLDTQRKLEPACAPICAKHSLDGERAAHAAAIRHALLIRHCAKVLDPTIAFRIAAYGFVEGSKTAPDPVHGSPDPSRRGSA